jgi:hypothetical protein
MDKTIRRLPFGSKYHIDRVCARILQVVKVGIVYEAKRVMELEKWFSWGS